MAGGGPGLLAPRDFQQVHKTMRKSRGCQHPHAGAGGTRGPRAALAGERPGTAWRHLPQGAGARSSPGPGQAGQAGERLSKAPRRSRPALPLLLRQGFRKRSWAEPGSLCSALPWPRPALFPRTCPLHGAAPWGPWPAQAGAVGGRGELQAGHPALALSSPACESPARLPPARGRLCPRVRLCGAARHGSPQHGCPRVAARRRQGRSCPRARRRPAARPRPKR